MPTSLYRAILVALLGMGAPSAVTWAGDLSRYRNFQLGSGLTAVAKQTGSDLDRVKVIHTRPSLIQELIWRPQPLSGPAQAEPVNQVVFRFFDGMLFQISVDYDRYQTEGLSDSDIVGAISADLGVATKPRGVTKPADDGHFDQRELVAEWQDSQYCFELTRIPYGPTFRLVGTLKTLEALAKTALLEAERLDQLEAPQREAERVIREDGIERERLDKARRANKPNFRP